MKKLVFLLSALLFTTMVFAQTDFSGSWELNTSKSKLGERSFAPKSATIIQTKADISIETKSEFNGEERVRKNKYTLDGKECTNKGFRDMDVKSTAVWSADKKALTVTSKVSTDNGDMTMKAVYKMDGANLVIESSASSPMGDRSETQVFNKK
jgi:hypothetical protein